MTPPAPSPASDYRFLLLLIPSLFILLFAVGLFEFSSNITVDNFHNLTSRLMHRASEASKESLDPTHFLVEIKSRYIWLTTVVALVAGLYALIFRSLQDHFPQFWLMLAPLLASPLSALLFAPLTPTG